MKSIGRCDRLVSYTGLVLICAIIFSLFISNQFLITAVADHKEFEVENYDENITLTPNTLGAIDFDLYEGEKFEIVFTLQVKEKLPVDVWFVNEDHYTLLVNGAQFLYFIDGSEQEITYTKKIVTLTEPDLYKLVITNYYNNQTVDANVLYEIRIYNNEVGETSSNNMSSLVLPLSILVIVLVMLLLILLLKARGYKQKLNKISKITPSKKQKLRKSKKHKPKTKDKPSFKEAKTPESKETEAEVADEATPSFCGYCGTPITTPYCTNCGRKVLKI